MNKKDLVTKISEITGFTKKDSEKALNAFMESVEQALINDEKVSLVGFGNFEVRNKAPRSGFNPKTKEPILIPAKKSPAFKASKLLKDSVNK